MNKRTSILAGLVLAGAVATPGLVSAYQGDPSVQGPNYTAERHQAIMEAFENNDYQAFKEQMQAKGRVAEVINEDNFSRFAEAHRLAIEGKTDEARQIREELGLGQHDGSGRGEHRGKGMGRWSK